MIIEMHELYLDHRVTSSRRPAYRKQGTQPFDPPHFEYMEAVPPE